MDKQLKNTDPPIWADRFFEWYCNTDLQEEILGDLYESFIDRVESSSLWQAKIWYWLQVILFINRRTLSRKNHYSTLLNSIDMFRNYFKIGYRNILKNKGTTFINAFGMALAIGCCLVVFQFIHWWSNLDDFHSKKEEIYVIQREVTTNGEMDLWNDVPQPLGPAIAADFPQIETVARINWSRGTMQFEDKIFSEWVSFVDPAYHELLDFEVKWGNKATFGAPDGIVLKAAIAEKYFGSRNPVGKEISIRFNNKEKEIVERFTIKGVLEKVPNNASFSDNILIPFQRQKVLQEKMEDWTYLSNITFIQAKNPDVIANIKAKEQKYLSIINDANENWDMSGLHFQPLTTVAQNGYKVKNNPFHTSHIIAVFMLIFIASALLVLVCFNYINITVAAASTRLKEISVRKVLGSNRQQIILQFLSENVIVCLLSLGIGILLAQYFFMPWFNRLGDTEFTISYLNQPGIWFFTIALVIITAIGGAGYPALYLSKFQPVTILKKEFKVGKKGSFRKVLLGGQLLLTIITIFSTIAFMLTSRTLQKKDWGYNQHDLAVIQLQHETDFEKFKNNIETNPDILEITGSQERMGRQVNPLKVQIAGQEHDVHSLTVSNNYLQTLGIPVIDGRSFDPKLESEGANSVLVNETFRRAMNWERAEGQNIKINNQNYYIIGETKDFHQKDFFEEIKPLVFQTNSEANYKYVYIRTLPGSAEKVAKTLESNWKDIYPNAPYRFFFQDGVFDNYFHGFMQVNSILYAASFMTILIAIIGLFGLAMLILARKMKELSIRKILGANIFHISQIIHKEFFVPLLVAIIIGLPLSFFLMKGLLSQIAPLVTVGWLPFLLTILSIVLMLGLSLVKHIYTAAVSNPSKFLKDE